jgi:hypothetical protein
MKEFTGGLVLASDRNAEKPRTVVGTVVRPTAVGSPNPLCLTPSSMKTEELVDDWLKEG